MAAVLVAQAPPTARALVHVFAAVGDLHVVVDEFAVVPGQARLDTSSSASRTSSSASRPTPSTTICAAWRTASRSRRRWTRCWLALPSRSPLARTPACSQGGSGPIQGTPGVGRGQSMHSGLPEGGPGTRSNSLHHPQIANSQNSPCSACLPIRWKWRLILRPNDRSVHWPRPDAGKQSGTGLRAAPGRTVALGEAAPQKMDCKIHKAAIVSSWLQPNAGVRRAS